MCPSSVQSQGLQDGPITCDYCGASRPCAEACPLSLRNLKNPNLQLLRSYTTGRFKVATFSAQDDHSSSNASPASTSCNSPTSILSPQSTMDYRRVLQPLSWQGMTRTAPDASMTGGKRPAAVAKAGACKVQRRGRFLVVDYSGDLVYAAKAACLQGCNECDEDLPTTAPESVLASPSSQAADLPSAPPPPIPSYRRELPAALAYLTPITSAAAPLYTCIPRPSPALESNTPPMTSHISALPNVQISTTRVCSAADAAPAAMAPAVLPTKAPAPVGLPAAPPKPPRKVGRFTITEN